MKRNREAAFDLLHFMQQVRSFLIGQGVAIDAVHKAIGNYPTAIVESYVDNQTVEHAADALIERAGVKLRAFN